MKKIAIFLLLATPLAGWSQTKVYWHVTYQSPLSLCEFRSNSDPDIGAGARFNLYFRPTPVFPVQFGIDAGIFGRGRAVRTIPVDIAGFTDDYEVVANNTVGSLGLLVKLEPGSGKRITPYLEGTIGANSFYSTVHFSNTDNSSSTIAVDRTDATRAQWALYYGGSAGLKIAFGKEKVGGIELKCSYLRGSATYYNAKPGFDDANNVVFPRAYSTTDMLIPQVGFWVDFGGLRDAERGQQGG